MTTLSVFLSGAVTMSLATAALFFLRFWRRTRDGLFVAFAVAFGLLALQQALLALSSITTEERSLLFLLRLAAFAAIVGAIVRKNSRR